MEKREETFIERLRRIEAEEANPIRRRSKAQTRARPVLVIHGDGVVTTAKPTPRRLRFGFPLRGVITASIVVVLVKGFVIWALGSGEYTAQIEAMRDGPRPAQIAAHILAPDDLSLWIVSGYDILAQEFRRLLGV